MKYFFKKIHSYLTYTFAFLLPWQTILIIQEVYYGSEKWQYGTIGIYASDITLFLWICIGIYLYKDQLLSFISLHKNIFIPGALLSLWGLASILWSDNTSLALYFAIKLSLAINLFFLLHVVPIDLKKISISFVISMSIHSTLGLYQFLSQNTFAYTLLGLQHHDIWHGSTAIINSEHERWLRAYGGLPHPNIFGGLLLIGLLLSMWLYISRKDRSLINSFFFLGASALLFSNVILTFSRTIWIATLLSSAVFFIFALIDTSTKNIQKYIFNTIILLVIILALFTITFPQLFIARKNDTIITHNSISDRKVYITHAQKSIYQKPFYGTGIGNYTNSVAKNDQYIQPIWYYQPVHNIYILITAEIGLVGFVLFCTLLFYICLTNYKDHKKISLQKMTLLLIVIMLLSISFFDHWIWTSHVGILTLFLFLGLFATKQKTTSSVVKTSQTKNIL